MIKKAIIGSGILALVSLIAGRLLERLHSPLTDFTRIVCFPALTLIFLVCLFVAPVRRISASPVTRNIFRWLRVAGLLWISFILLAVFWPRSYGTPPPQYRSDIRYWDLPTGSRIAYTLIPAKGVKKRNPIIYLQGGPGGTVDNGLIRILTPLSEEGYDVYLYDQIGSGWSGRLGNISDYTADRHKRDLEAIVQKTGAEKVILIGQSWGAILPGPFSKS